MPGNADFEMLKKTTTYTRVLPSPAGPAGGFPLNFLNLVNLKFRVRALNGCCILCFQCFIIIFILLATIVPSKLDKIHLRM